MSDEHEPKPPEEASDAPSKGDYAALGIGCLVTILLLGAAMFLGYARG